MVRPWPKLNGALESLSWWGGVPAHGRGLDWMICEGPLQTKPIYIRLVGPNPHMEHIKGHLPMSC